MAAPHGLGTKPGAFSLDGTGLLAKGNGQYLYWDRPVPHKLIARIKVRRICLCPDGQVLATWGRDQDDTVIQLWEVATGNVFAALSGGNSRVRNAVFSPDGRAPAAGYYDGSILLWDSGLERLGKAGAGKPEPDDLARCWKVLAATDAVPAHEAMGLFARHPGASLPFLRERLQPVNALPAERIQALIARLDGDAFETREEAYQELRRLGNLAAPELRQALAKKPGLDAHLALERLLEELNFTQMGVPPGECLRGIRAVRVLESLATAEAKQLLDAWPRGLWKPP